VPLVVLPAGHPRRQAGVKPNFSAALNFRHVTKWVEQVTVADAVPEALRRAFTQAKNGRPGPSLIELPVDILEEDIAAPTDYRPSPRLRSAPDPAAVKEVAAALAAAERLVIYAGQGIHYGKAWAELKALAELLEAPVCTSLPGKSAFPENHPLALGSGGATYSKQLHHFLQNADLIFGIGCSFTSTPFGVAMPKGKRIIHATLDATDINKDVPATLALVGDAKLALAGLIEDVKSRIGGKPRGRLAAVTGEVKRVKDEWLAQWAPRLNSESSPLSPYRVIRDLMATIDRDNAIVTHDSGGPRNQLTPFWESTMPMSYLGWGKSTQLGYGLGLAMGAKLASPDKLCINVWGDAAIGFTGMDLETAVRERIPILSILLNNSAMAAELNVMKVATNKFRSTDISGNYADLARSLGLWSERVSEPGQIVPAIKRGIAQTRDGVPALLEFITEKSTERSNYR
jgi:acetolactate synthase-1/2/3 large subunit